MEGSVHKCQLYIYDSEDFSIQTNTPEYFAEHFAGILNRNKEKVAWLNFHSLQSRESIFQLIESLGVERPVAEDIFVETKRTRLEEYDDYMFFKIKSALPNKKNLYLEEEQISFVIHENFIISFQHKSSDHFSDVRERIETNRGKIRSRKSDFLLFKLLEAITENYFEVLEDIVSSIEYIESRLAKHAKSDILKRIEIQKRKLIELRRVVYPLRDITSQLQKMQLPAMKKENRYYFSKLNENCLSILEDIDANKQILEGLNNLYYAVQSQRLNEIMKVMTIVSTIFNPLTFIVGVYGMNFKNMPELESRYGYFIVWGLMFIITLSLIAYFKVKGWLKK